MKLRLLAVGHKMPAWVEQGFAEYAKRLPADCSIELVEIPPGHRAKNTSKEKAMQQEPALVALRQDNEDAAEIMEMARMY